MSIAFEENGLTALVRERIDQWRAGKQPDAAAFLDEHPEVQTAKSLVLDLVLEEYCLRTEAGDTVVRSTFCERFPAYRQSIVKMLEVKEYLDQCPQFAAELEGANWPLPGDRFMGYDVVEPLGRGALARVYLAREPALGKRPVVIKVSRFGAREAETLGKLSHPNIVPVHSVRHDEVTGWTVICMPLLGMATAVDLLDASRAGGPAGGGPRDGMLIARVAQQTRPLSFAPPAPPEAETRQWRGPYSDAIARFGLQLAEGLTEAHRAGVLHRDIKPSNVLLAWSGRPMLLDFNLSSDEAAPSERIGGTLAYMAPEVIASLIEDRGAAARRCDPRSDVYSLGAVLYELLTGRLPAQPENASRLPLDAYEPWLASKHQPPLALRSLRPQIDARLNAIVLKCLALDPAKRYATAEALAAELRTYLGLAGTLRRYVKRNRRGVLFSALALLLIAASLAGYIGTRPPYHQRLLTKALTQYDAGNYAGAVETLNQSLLVRSDFPEAHFARGQAHRKLGKWTEARTDFVALKDVNPGWAHALAGWCSFEARQYVDAANAFTSAHQAGVTHRHVMLRWAHAASKANNNSEAVAVHTMILKEDPTDCWALCGRAEAHMAMSFSPSGKAVPLNMQAVEDVSAACRIEPGSLAAHYLAAKVFDRAAKELPKYTEDALKHLTRAREIGLPWTIVSSQFARYKEAIPEELQTPLPADSHPKFALPSVRDLPMPGTADWHAFLQEVEQGAE
jgi:serine/threonine protein kinase